MYIYGADYINESEIGGETFDEGLKRIPYGFIERVGSIRFMNQAEGLHRVVRYVRADFLMKALKLNPESEFDVKKLSKNMICEFIDEGYKPFNDFEDDIKKDEELYFRINMGKARILLPVLKKIGAVHITDGWWSNPIREDVPKEFLDGILKMCEFDRSLFEEGYYNREYNISYIRYGLETVTDYKNTAKERKEERWELSINEKGSELLEWLNK